MPLLGRKKEAVPAQTGPVTVNNSLPSSSNNEIQTSRRSFSGGLLRRKQKSEDPSIAAARERVLRAEQAERDADSALQRARNSVRDAREHVKRLESEVEAEAKAARIKQGQAKDLGRRAKPLGRKLCCFDVVLVDVNVYTGHDRF